MMHPPSKPEQEAIVLLPTATVPSYLQTVIGKRSPISVDIEEFRGLPYAHVPGRWEHSRLRDCLPRDIFDATENGPRCPAPGSPDASVFQSYLPFPNDREDEFECLNLLIVRPSKAALAKHGLDAEVLKLPVLVYIHGGGFADGAATSPVHDPARLVLRSLSKKTPFIMVAINYRLNIFGFGASSDMLAAQSSHATIKGVNFGLRDQKLALIWIQRNIAAFGGDEDKVTIMGHSAGAISCHVHLLEAELDTKRPLFRKAFILSGAWGGLDFRSLAIADERWADLCRLWAVQDESPRDRLNMLKRIPVKDLLRSVSDLHWRFFILVVDELTIRTSNRDCEASFHFGHDGMDNQVKGPSDEQIQVVLSTASHEFSGFARMANWDYDKFRSLFASCYPSEAAAENVLQAYNVLHTTSPEDLLEGFGQFISDATMCLRIRRAGKFLKAHRGQQALLSGQDANRVGVKYCHFEFGYVDPSEKAADAAASQASPAAGVMEYSKSNIELSNELQDKVVQFIVEDNEETAERANADEITTYCPDRSTRSGPSLRKPTSLEAATAFFVLLPFLCSLIYRLYAKIQRRAGRSVGLQILSESSSDEIAKYEIVAVHGLGANPEHTWTCKPRAKTRTGDAPVPVHLLKDLLMKDDRFSDARILHFAYNSDWLVDACFESARDIGLRLMEALIRHRETHARLPLIFVGHSFGGIVIKEALSSNPDDTQNILEDTCGVIFLGTPHLGSPVAGYGATIAYLTGFLGSNTGLLLSLRSTGDLLVNLSKIFQQCVNRKKRDTNKETEIVSICEKKPTYLLNWLYAGKIVPWESAAFGANFANVIEVDKDHSGLNKCLNSEDPLYKELTAQLCRIKPNVPPKINKLQQAVIDRLTPVIASDAEFHPGGDVYGGHSECLPHTREQLLNDICNWLYESDASQKHLYWLQGKAGTGKSTIARTVVSRMSRKKRIVANFFFKRGEGDRARLKRFFTTISAQLVRKLPSLAQMVQDALESEPSLPEQGPQVQFRKLIKEPLQAQTSCHDKAIVIVVDALDECDSKEDLIALVQQLSQSIVRTQGQSSSGQLLVKYVITSRLDHHTQAAFNRVPEDISEKRELESATSGTTKQDIECYLKIHLQNIDGFLNPLSESDPWSNPADVGILKKLADRADPLFEFAAAACRYIAQPTLPGGPRVLIQDILDSNSYGDLDGVYLPILRRRFVDLKGPLRDRAWTAFRDVIGSVLCLADSVTVPCLAMLLGQDELAVRQELLLFQSVLVVPKKQDRPLPISLFHESFRDFLIAPGANEEFKLDIQSIHRRLATRCLKVLRGTLKENICNLKSPGTHRSEIDEETIRTSISEEAQYACKFWIHHLKQCGNQLSDRDDWHLFLSSHFLHWLEALALIGRFSETVPLITGLEAIIHPTDGAQVGAFLDDAHRFIQYFGQIINVAPLQIYSSALAFSPTESIIRRSFVACLPKWITRAPVVEAQWSACLQTLEGHEADVTSIALSPEGLLASGDRHGNVKIWDTESGTCLHTLRMADELWRYSFYDTTMVFSKTGKLIS
ncbi:hypothetical protein TgHK011_003496 [Trichoderma gracile]|nr:hypothetical protein TgHK011_003496 [Trichoderma gracile]